MTDPETIALRPTVIGGQSYADDFEVIWRGLPIGRIMRQPGLPPHVPQWRWTCNFYGKPVGGGGAGSDLDDCKKRFRAMWASVRAGLTEDDIARAHQMRLIGPHLQATSQGTPKGDRRHGEMSSFLQSESQGEKMTAAGSDKAAQCKGSGR